MKRKKLAIIDTSVLITFLFGESQTDPDTEEKNQKTLQEFEHLVKESFDLGLPAIVPPEITSSKIGDKPGWPDAPGRLEKFESFLQDTAGVQVLEFDGALALQAARLAAQGMMKAGDATILAAALAYKADVLLSWDTGLLASAKQCGQVARKPDFHGHPMMDLPFKTG